MQALSTEAQWLLPKNMFAFPKFVAARIIDPIARHTSRHQSSGALSQQYVTINKDGGRRLWDVAVSEWTLSQQYVWQSTRVLVGDFEMYVCDSQQSTMAEEGDVLIVLLWTLRQQCVFDDQQQRWSTNLELTTIDGNYDNQ